MRFVFLLILFNFKLMASECPENNTSYFCKPADRIENKEINAANFITIPKSILKLFSKEINELNYPLSLDALWESPFFGAGVSLYENQFHLMILGGTTRMKEMTTDAYAAIVCHELGHLLGGEPLQTIPNSEWASAEGQADHFAASVCLPKYFKQMGLTNDVQINAKIEKAGADFIYLATKIESDPKNKKFIRGKVKLPKVSETIINRYPTLQCRYETYRNPQIRPSCWYRN